MPEKEFLKIVDKIKPDFIYYDIRGWFQTQHAFTISEEEKERWTIVLNNPKELFEELAKRKIQLIDIDDFEEVPKRICG